MFPVGNTFQLVSVAVHISLSAYQHQLFVFVFFCLFFLFCFVLFFINALPYLFQRHLYPSLVLVQPRKNRPYITERLLMGRKESNQTYLFQRPL